MPLFFNKIPQIVAEFVLLIYDSYETSDQLISYYKKI